MTLSIQVLLFARARELAGAGEIVAPVPSGTRVADLRRIIAAHCPALASMAPRCAIAVNEEYADETRVLESGDRVALLPPVSGG